MRCDESIYIVSFIRLQSTESSNLFVKFKNLVNQTDYGYANMRHAAFKINIYLTSLVYKNRYFKTEIYPNLLGLPNNC